MARTWQEVSSEIKAGSWTKKGHSPAWDGKQGGGNARQLVTLLMQSQI